MVSATILNLVRVLSSLVPKWKSVLSSLMPSMKSVLSSLMPYWESVLSSQMPSLVKRTVIYDALSSWMREIVHCLTLDAFDSFSTICVGLFQELFVVFASLEQSSEKARCVIFKMAVSV